MDSKFIVSSQQFNEKFFTIGETYLITEYKVNGHVLRMHGIISECEPL